MARTRGRGGGDNSTRGNKAAKVGGGTRALKERVKTARGRKTSSTRWLQRQLNDPYVAAAKAQGFRSRAAFKLLEIDDKFHFLKPGATIIDLGAVPGGWSQIAAQRVGTQEGHGQVIALDINPMEPLPGVRFFEFDFLDDAAVRVLLETLDNGKADVVLSDMAAPASGHRQTDHMKIMALCEAAADFAVGVLAPGGTFLAKVLRGGTENELLAAMKRDYTTIRHVKPKASRSDSAETYVLATGFRGQGIDEPELA